MRTSIAKTLAAISLAALGALSVAPAHASMDYAMATLTGVSTGSPMSMLGAQMHQIIHESDEQEARELSPQEAQAQATADRFAMRALVWVMMAFGAAGLVFLIGIARL